MNNQIIKWFAVFVASAVFCFPAPGVGNRISAQSNNRQIVKQPVAIKLEREKLGKIPTISVKIKGKDYAFFFDSGGAVTSISPQIAAEIGCNPFGQMTGYNAGGKEFKMKRCDDVEMNVGGFAVKLDTTVGNAMNFFPPGTPQIDGMISLHTFENQIITMDLIKNVLQVETEKSFKKKIKDMKPLKSRLSRELGGYGVDIFFAASSPKGKIWLLVDTGNTNKLLLAPHAQEQLNIAFDEPKDKTFKLVELDLLGYGKIETVGRDRTMIYDGMLNYDTILKMLLTIDLRTGEAWAKPNQ